MSGRFYAFLVVISNIFGAPVFAVTARGIAAGYFFLFPRRAAASAGFYRAVFPERSRLYSWWCAWRQFQNFTTLFLDRYVFGNRGDITYTSQGREHLFNAVNQGRGGIMLISHMGNWEMAARLLREMIPELRLMIIMGRRAKEQIERMQKEDLSANGIRIIVADQDAGTPFALVEVASFLQAGGFVAMAGDKLWRSDQRAVSIRIFKHTARLPEAPFTLALLSSVPLYVFFSSIRGRGRHHFSISDPLTIKAEERSLRKSAVLMTAQEYADLLADQVRKNPLEWFHFEPFLEPEAAPACSMEERLGPAEELSPSNTATAPSANAR